MIEIWEPRWHDKTVLIAKFKVKPGVNRITFTKWQSMKGKVFDVGGHIISQCPTDTNGSIDCYVVPLELIVGKEQ